MDLLNRPLVSVIMITYNHGKYIEEAINGVLNQKTNFEIELIIANDNSSDDTDSIISLVLKKHPFKKSIKYHKQVNNIGMMPNFLFSYGIATGKYIALCEGDDYWTDNFKLQKQIDILEANQEYSFCYHRVNILSADGNFHAEENNTILEPRIYYSSDLAVKNFIHTPSVVFRKIYDVSQLPKWFINTPVGDYPLHMLHSKNGPIYYLPDVMAVYRIHYAGVWSKKTDLFRIEKWTEMLQNLITEFTNDDKIYQLLATQLSNNYNHLFEVAYNNKDSKNAAQYLFKIFNLSEYERQIWVQSYFEKRRKYELLKKYVGITFFKKLKMKFNFK